MDLFFIIKYIEDHNIKIKQDDKKMLIETPATIIKITKNSAGEKIVEGLEGFALKEEDLKFIYLILKEYE